MRTLLLPFLMVAYFGASSALASEEYDFGADGLSDTAQASYSKPSKSATKAGFEFPKDAPVRILVFRPDVRVTEASASGIDLPKAQWTEEARVQLAAALQRAEAKRALDIMIMPELSGNDSKIMANYRALFKTVADAIIRHSLFSSDPLPSKGDAFEWTLGKEINRLGVVGGGDYGLFLYTKDSYPSSSRRTAAILSGVKAGEDSSEVHIGYAGLVDLKSGDLVWINVDVRIGGDVRTAEGADTRIRHLLRGFPQREITPIKGRKR